ncbi:response regulator [Consotaella aegiceratis]|uniref:response regulator n=1 Tax=Consotaella aegiceratis TaxID=3097961 RepID=UPI002F3E500B
MANILVVDDDPLIQGAVRASLQRHGFAVALAGDGVEGLEISARWPIDLAIVDLFMPNMEGIETLRTLRQRQPDLPVIVMSGSMQASGPRPPAGTNGKRPDFLSMAVALGACATLQKPFSSEELNDMVVRHCKAAS